MLLKHVALLIVIKLCILYCKAINAILLWEPIYYVLQNDNEKDSTGTNAKSEVAQASEDIPANDDAPPAPEYNPVDDDIIDDDGTTDVSVSGDATLRLSSDSTNYT